NSTVTLTTSSSPSSPEHQIILHSLSAEGLCSSDGVIIQTVTSDASSSDPLGQSQLIVETAGQEQEVGLEASSLLVGDECVSSEAQPMTDGFTDKVLSSTSVETSALAPGSTVLIVSAPISSTLTDPILENQEGSD
ncbi:unnamed protein product, partial [Boreogadus saida]